MRAQSNVIGVALLLGVTVVALGSLTASIGAIVDSNAATADASRVATDFDNALEPVAATGPRRGRVSFTDGSLGTEERELRVLDDDGVVKTVQVDALVFTSRDRRVTILAGAIIRGMDAGARMYDPPPITSSRSTDGGVLLVGAPKLNASGDVAVGGHGSVMLRTDVTHHRMELGEGEYRVAVETETPAAWVDHFERQGATIESTDRKFRENGAGSVVARFPGSRTGYLVVHDMRLEVGS